MIHPHRLARLLHRDLRGEAGHLDCLRLPRLHDHCLADRSHVTPPSAPERIRPAGQHAHVARRPFRGTVPVRLLQSAETASAGSPGWGCFSFPFAAPLTLQLGCDTARQHHRLCLRVTSELHRSDVFLELHRHVAHGVLESTRRTYIRLPACRGCARTYIPKNGRWCRRTTPLAGKPATSKIGLTVQERSGRK